MKRLLPTLTVLGACAAVTAACAYNEALGRNQLLITDNAGLTQQSDTAWAEALRTRRRTREYARSVAGWCRQRC
jgi:hypothetical protein